MSDLGRLRIPGGARIWRPSLVAIALLLLSLGTFADEPTVTTKSYAYVGMNGYHTRLSVTNPTADPIDVRRPCPDGQSSCPPITDRIQPRRTVSIADWPRLGSTDVEALTLDSRLHVFTEVTTHLGTIFRTGALAPRTSTVWLFDLPAPGDFQNLLWLAVAPGQEGTFLTVIDEGDLTTRSFLMNRGAITHNVIGPVVRIVPGSAPGWPLLPAPAEFYVMPVTVHNATGAATAQIE